MTTTVVMTWIVIGLATGWTARGLVRDGGYGLGADLLLGIAGSSAGSVALWAFSAAPDAGPLVMAMAALVGATTTLVAQRNVWAAPIVVRRRVAPRR